MDFDLLQQNYFGITINSDVSVSVQGIGETQSLWFVHMPTWIDGFRKNEGEDHEYTLTDRRLIQLEGEFHLVIDFGYGVLMEVDMMTDYSIARHLCQARAAPPGFLYKIQSTHTKFRSVLC